MPTEQVLNKLIINKVDSYDTLKAMKNAGLLNETELYLVEEDEEAGGGAGAQVHLPNVFPLVVTIEVNYSSGEPEDTFNSSFEEMKGAITSGRPIIIMHHVIFGDGSENWGQTTQVRYDGSGDYIEIDEGGITISSDGLFVERNG